MLDHALKAQQWEIIKGHLRALVSLQGAYNSAPDSSTTERFLTLDEKVEVFIKDVEDEALHE